MKRPRDHTQALLQKAANDLVAAQATLSTGQALDTVCFHAQQAVEKSLKAILALHDIEYPWWHDLSELFELVRPLASELILFEEQMFRMTPYAVEVRYDEEFEPSLDEASEALEVAKEVCRLSSNIVYTA
jgi:HEPN domain-containing protein